MRSIPGKTQIMRMRIGHIFMACLVGSCTSFQMMIPMASSPEATRLSRREATQESDDNNDRSNAASLRSITFSNLPKQQEPQLLGNFLMELGACSTSITDADAGTDSEMALFDEFDPTTMTRTAVTTHVWGRCHVSAQFPASTDLDWIMDIVQDSFPDLPKYTLQEVEDKDWVLHVQQQWKPIILPPFCLRFPWHSDSLVQNAIEDSGFDENSIVPLQLQGGIAFGTGEHPTTQVCLDWIGKICSSISSSSSSTGESKKKLMDYGSGSGVLGIAASKLDDTLEAVGVDIDVDAVLIANENCQINDVGMKNYLSNLIEAQDDESQSVLLSKSYYSSKEGQTGAEVLPKDLDGPIYDAVVANILAGPLVVLAPRLAGLLKPSCGKLGLSGIMTSQSNMILDSYEPYFDDLKVEQELGGWVLITGTRKED